MLKKKLRNQKGFTLIEIIAVLVILGILAAVAIPKYFGMQEQAANKVADAAVASGYAALAMGWAAAKLGTPGAPNPETACQGVQLEGTTITSIVCTGTTWPASGVGIPLVVTYTGGTSTTKTRSWKAP